MATVNSIMAKLVQRVDPYTKAGVEITAATVGSVDGDRFTKQRQLDLLNDSRLALLNALRPLFSIDQLTDEISGNVVETQIEFTRASIRDEYTLPSGYVKFLALDGFSTTSKKIEPIILLPDGYLNQVRRGVNPHFIQSNDVRFVFEMGTKLIHFGVYGGDQGVTGTVEVNVGTSDVTILGTGTAFFSELAVGAFVTITGTQKTIASIGSNTSATVTVAYSGSKGAGSPMSVENYHLKYIGITNYALSDVLTGSSTAESFNTGYHSLLLDLAEALANGQGEVEVNSLVRGVLKIGGN